MTPPPGLQPLDGFVIGVTADRRASEQAELLTRRGGSVLHGPTITTEYLAGDDALHAATLAVIDRRPAFVIATTGIGIRAWFEAAQAWALNDQLFDALRGARIAARGPKAAAALSSVGLTAHLTAPSEQLDDTLALLAGEPLAGTAIAFQHFGERRDDAVATLVARGGDVIEVPIYRWRLPADDAAAVRLVEATISRGVDALTFTSAPAITNLVAIAQRLGVDDQLFDICNNGDVVVACIGPVCAAAAEAAGFTRCVAPTRGRLGLLVRSVTDALAERRTTITVSGRDVVVQGKVVFVDGVVVSLSPRERAVFDALIRRNGGVVSKETLLRTVWEGGSDAHAVETTIARLRKRLGPAGTAIQPVRGRGYRINGQGWDGAAGAPSISKKRSSA